MSYLQRKANYAYGVSTWLRKQGVDTTRKTVNKIHVDFLKSMSLSYKLINYRYKGLNSEDLINAEHIQEHWSEFINWFKENKELYFKQTKDDNKEFTP